MNTALAKCPKCPVKGYRADMRRHVARCLRLRPAPTVKPRAVRYPRAPTLAAEFEKAHHQRKRLGIVSEPESSDASYQRTTERVIYAPHYARRGYTLRRLSVVGVTPRVLAEFQRWEEEQEVE